MAVTSRTILGWVRLSDYLDILAVNISSENQR